MNRVYLWCESCDVLDDNWTKAYKNSRKSFESLLTNLSVVVDRRSVTDE